MENKNLLTIIVSLFFGFIIVIVIISTNEKIDDLTNDFKYQTKLLNRKIDKLNNQLSENQYSQNKIEFENVITTVYHPVKGQCDSTPNITASCEKINMNNPYGHRWIAVSRDFLNKYNFKYGDVVELSGFPKENNQYNGKWTINDTMNKRFENHIDLLVGKKQPVGKWTNIKLTKIN